MIIQLLIYVCKSDLPFTERVVGIDTSGPRQVSTDPCRLSLTILMVKIRDDPDPLIKIVMFESSHSIEPAVSLSQVNTTVPPTENGLPVFAMILRPEKRSDQ